MAQATATGNLEVPADAPKVLIPSGVDESGAQWLSERGYHVVPVDSEDLDAIYAELRNADAVLARTEPYPRDVLDAAINLKIVARYGVGTDNVDVDRATELGIWVTAGKGANTTSVAEHTLALILACAKHIFVFSEHMLNGDWAIRDRLRTIELSGKTLGVIGVGSIGQAVAAMAHDGLNMNIMGIDAFADWSGIPSYIRQANDLAELCSHSDVVTVHVAVTPETKGLIAAPTLAVMKRDAILINTSRGGVVNEEDLYTALREGRIAAAGCDVFAIEPPDPGNPLFGLENFVATPHVAGAAREAHSALALSAAQAIHDVLSGRLPHYPVNKPAARAT